MSMDKLKPWLERVDALKLNERVLLLAALLLVVVKVWDGLLLAPMTAERVRLQSEVETLGAALRASRRKILVFLMTVSMVVLVMGTGQGAARTVGR